MCKTQRIKVLLPILIRIRPREIQIKRPPRRDSKEHCLHENKLRNPNVVMPGEVSEVELPTEANLEEASQKVLRPHQPESTIPRIKNRKVPQKILRMKRA
jgi:hypothetical protein|tara:strand:+ start:213 stop:512 length:300 start_codon:yes stop_codon:yes gene_type:complete